MIPLILLNTCSISQRSYQANVPNYVIIFKLLKTLTILNLNFILLLKIINNTILLNVIKLWIFYVYFIL